VTHDEARGVAKRYDELLHFLAAFFPGGQVPNGPYLLNDYIAANEQAEREHERMGQVAIEAYNAVLAKLQAAEQALAEIHRTTGRGDGHGSVKDTTSCIISAFASLRCDMAEIEREAKEAESRAEKAEGELAAARDYERELEEGGSRIAKRVAERFQEQLEQARAEGYARGKWEADARRRLARELTKSDDADREDGWLRDPIKDEAKDPTR
jgi:hypothetical protein